MAERVGFEPTVSLRLHTLSKRAPSTTRTSLQKQKTLKETLINCLYRRIDTLHGTRNLDYPVDMSRFLRSVRLALHPTQTINQGFLNSLGSTSLPQSV